MIGEHIFRITDNLAKALQATKLTASDGQEMARKTQAVLEGIRNDDSFNELYTAATERQCELGM